MGGGGTRLVGGTTASVEVPGCERQILIGEDEAGHYTHQGRVYGVDPASYVLTDLERHLATLVREGQRIADARTAVADSTDGPECVSEDQHLSRIA